MTLNNTPSPPVVLARNLSKSYRGKPVLNGFDLEVTENQLCGLWVRTAPESPPC